MGGPHSDPLKTTFIDPAYTGLTDENLGLPDRISEQGLNKTPAETKGSRQNQKRKINGKCYAIADLS